MSGNFSDYTFVHSNNQNDAWAQWEVQYSFPTGSVNLLSDIGKYLSKCSNCGSGAYPDSASVSEKDPSKPWAIWTAERVGDLVALKSSETGNYLSRCNNCWGSGAYADSAFVHITSLDGNPYALWKPVNVGSGKWALQADTGKFLARCNNCVPGGNFSNYAFVHSTNQNDAWAQWTVTTR